MKASKKITEKLVALVMIFSLVGPIFLSSTVSAAENLTAPKDAISEEQSKASESEDSTLFGEDIIESTESSSEIENDEGIVSESEEPSVDGEEPTGEADQSEIDSSNEDTIENEKADATIEAEDNQATEADIDTEKIEQVEEYYSAEETREQAIEMMEAEQNSVSTYSAKTRAVSKTNAFINATSSYAVTVAKKYDLYPSVMIAQAALESAWGTSILAYNPNFNYFGIKGNYNGNSFSKYTKEYNEKDGWKVIKADFKKYPSVNETFIDYANKLTKGPEWDSKNGSWDKNYYSGTWKKNAKTYQDATKALKGKYATDPDYNTKLNSIIKTYDLTRFDKATSDGSNGDKLEGNLKEINYDEVVSTTDVKDYSMYINGKSDGIYTAPKGTKDSKVTSTTMEYQDEKVVVTEEKKTKDGLTWAHIKLNGKYLGWIDKTGLSKGETILSQKNINYTAKVNRKTDGINTQPWGVEGYKLVAMSSAYYGGNVTITKEIVTNRATWSYIDGLGWIDKQGLDIEKITSTKNTSYLRRISRKTDGINTQPWGTEGFKLVAMTSDYFGKQVKVLKEAKTRRSTWAYISLDGKELGWIDMKGLTDSDVILSEKNINYTAKVNRKTDGINTQPWGVKGYKLVAMSSAYYGKNVTITKEMVTTRSTWSYIKGMGWIDKKGLDVEKITSTKNTSYLRRISRKTDGINTQPWGTEGFKLVAMSADYFGKQVKVLKEVKTRRSSWAYISVDGKELGWIDMSGLTDSDVILSEKNINYTAKVNRKTDGINTQPWGVEGYKLVAMSSAYYGKNVTVTKEMVTTRATWAYISSEGKNLGWIDKEGLTRVDLLKKVVVIDPGHGGKDPGAQAGGVNEKDLNLTVAKKVKQKLENSGYAVVMTRSTDKFLKLSEIADIANKANPDIFVSIHTNSFNGSTNGIETYSYTPGETKPINIVKSHNPTRLLNSSLLSQSIQGSLIKNTGAYNRQAKKANFVVVRDTWMPAVLVEMGFVDNAAERNKLVTNAYQDKIATGIIQGIQDYFKTVK